MLKATASSKLSPSFIANGAAAKAVAPDITKPCKNSGALNLICIKGILRVKGPHLIPLLCEVLIVFILIILTSPLQVP